VVPSTRQQQQQQQQQQYSTSNKQPRSSPSPSPSSTAQSQKECILGSRTTTHVVFHELVVKVDQVLLGFEAKLLVQQQCIIAY
jgi:hypothetical protein